MKYLDCILVPVGILTMVAYHIWLLHRIIKHPTNTIVGVNAISRRFWVHSMMEVRLFLLNQSFFYIYIEAEIQQFKLGTTKIL